MASQLSGPKLVTSRHSYRSSASVCRSTIAATVMYGRAVGPLGTTNDSASGVETCGALGSGAAGAAFTSGTAGTSGLKSERLGAGRFLTGALSVLATVPGFLLWIASPSLIHRLSWSEASFQLATSVWYFCSASCLASCAFCRSTVFSRASASRILVRASASERATSSSRRW
ncbi:hypothetical protein [Microbispora sp. GKU 823]|uniref:hypothetical protein n=1 Tax=Microbispora sp. GKU 823 TaxID=1652100 RepID=UPI0009A35B6A|nr:hypothetical protein [Microbispora sp. GKU 823]OPG09129.1 hypothetical protein B1L11_26710 [Microbispora sp. GKU 823]